MFRGCAQTSQIITTVKNIEPIQLFRVILMLKNNTFGLSTHSDFLSLFCVLPIKICAQLGPTLLLLYTSDWERPFPLTSKLTFLTFFSQNQNPGWAMVLKYPWCVQKNKTISVKDFYRSWTNEWMNYILIHLKAGSHYMTFSRQSYQLTEKHRARCLNLTWFPSSTKAEY